MASPDPSAIDGKTFAILAEGVRELVEGRPLARVGLFESGLGRLFAVMLDGQEGWSPYWWIDDAHVEHSDRLDDASVELTGVFIPGDERHQWMSPYRAILKLNDTRDRLTSFEVWLGEAGTALDAVPFGDRRPRHWPDVEAWTFHFEPGGPPPTALLEQASDANYARRMPVIEVPVELITDWDTFHDVFVRALHFPDYYGRNGDAFIDCLRDIANNGEVLTINLGDHVEEFRSRCPEQLEALQDWVAFVNADAVDEGRPPRILLAYR